MLGDKAEDHDPSTLIDTDSIYGWISILLHWLTAVAIIGLWILGKSILNSESSEIDARRALHISIAASFWVVILARIGWRIRSGHPRVNGLTNLIHNIAKTAHYLMLVLLLVMLTSGPMVVWAGGHAVTIFGAVSIPGPFNASESLRDIAWTVHSNAALALLLLVIAHIAGALKHLMFNSDDTIVRMLWPAHQDTTGSEK